MSDVSNDITSRIDSDLNESTKSNPKFKKSLLREYFESIIVTVIMALFGITFVVRSVNVPTGSMENTILAGDFLLVNKYIFGPEGIFNMNGYTPHRAIKRGSIIVFKFPPDPKENYVKRVIGLPGEIIEIRNQKIYINGKELPENRVISDQDPMDSGKLEVISEQVTEGASYKVFYKPESESEFGLSLSEIDQKYGVVQPYKIPENCYFAMGDNRDNSYDSRFWGAVPRSNIIGSPLFVYASVDHGDMDTSGKFKLGDFLSHGRWNRIGTLIK